MHFGLKGNKDGLPDPVEFEKPICCHCHRFVSAKQSNITNLFTHLHVQDNHPEIYVELAATKSKLTSQQSCKLLNRGKKYEACSKEAKEL